MTDAPKLVICKAGERHDPTHADLRAWFAGSQHKTTFIRWHFELDGEPYALEALIDLLDPRMERYRRSLIEEAKGDVDEALARLAEELGPAALNGDGVPLTVYSLDGPIIGKALLRRLRGELRRALSQASTWTIKGKRPAALTDIDPAPEANAATADILAVMETAATPAQMEVVRLLLDGMKCPDIDAEKCWKSGTARARLTRLGRAHPALEKKLLGI